MNVSATLDPTDPPSGDGPPSGDPTSLDSSKTKGKQSVDNLKIKLTVDQDSTLDLGGKAKVAQRAPASTAAKKKFNLKQKKGIGLQAGVKKVIGLKFKKNSKKGQANQEAPEELEERPAGARRWSSTWP